MANLQGVIRAPDYVNYALIWNGRGGRLRSPAIFQTGIPFAAEFRTDTVSCALAADGTLNIDVGTEWDFGSGPAVDTPAVVIASLAHDMICHLTNYRLIPWQCRAMGDRMYRVMLEQNGAGLVRRGVHWIGVRGYSELIARWRDKKCD